MSSKSSNNKNLPLVSVVGLGKLGASYAAFLASKGFSVLGFDIDAQKVARLEAGHAPIVESNLEEYVRSARGRLRATTDIGRLIAESDVTYIVVPTPSEKSGLFSVRYVMDALRAMGPALKRKKKWHTFVLISTVLPGDSRERIVPALERASGKKCGRDFGYVYSPSLIAVGDILNNLEHPDFLFLGAYDERSRKEVADMFAHAYSAPQAVEHMSVESAELAKIALNSFVTMKISFANSLAALAAKIPNADVDEITDAIGKDSRIGKRFLRGGLGFGGPCFPRDNRAFFAMAKRRNFTAHLARATDVLNDAVGKVTGDLLEAHARKYKPGAVGFLGVSYKPKTTHAEDSQALVLAQRLLHKKFRIIVFEPLGTHDAEASLGNKAEYADSLADLVKHSAVIFVSNPDPLLADLPVLLRKHAGRKVVIDPWGIFRGEKFPPSTQYVTPGRRTLFQKRNKNSPR